MSETIARAYVQVVPSTKGIGGALKSALGSAGDAAGSVGGISLGNALIKKLAKIGIGAAVGKAIKSSFEEGAALQQSLGGVETLFEKNADTVVKNAQVAYKTAGVSANAYMEGVTSFAASLLQSTAGNTKKAANISDMAFRDMSDNVNKFGSNFGDIQHAYQGFAKQNYTMLDNLKLGYGGTKSEMERLLADAEKLSGQKYDISSLADVYSAIHVVQEELGVTGTTAKEAATTFTGSFEAMKSAARNFLGAMTTKDMDAGAFFIEWAKSVGTFLKGGLLPLVGEFVTEIPNVVVTAFKELPNMILSELRNTVTNVRASVTSFFDAIPLATLLAGISNKITEYLSNAVDAVDEILDNITDAIQGDMPKHVSKITQTLQKVIPQIVAFILKNTMKFTEAVFRITVAIGSAMIKNAPMLISQAVKVAWELIKAVVNAILNHDWVATGKQAVRLLISGLKSMAGAVGSAALSLASAALRGIAGIVASFFGIGQNAANGLANGIIANIQRGRDAAKQLGEEVEKAAKKQLDEHSPSKKFKKIGAYAAQGFAIGLGDTKGAVKSSRKLGKVGESVLTGTVRGWNGASGARPYFQTGTSIADGFTRPVEIRMPVYMFPNSQKMSEAIYKSWNNGRKMVGNV